MDYRFVYFIQVFLSINVVISLSRDRERTGTRSERCPTEEKYHTVLVMVYEDANGSRGTKTAYAHAE